jgi:hypothetical protein
MRVEILDGFGLLIGSFVKQNCPTLREDTPNRDIIC